MPRVSRISEAPPEAVEQALGQLGRSIQTARQARGMTLDALAERVGTSRFVMADIESGKPTTAVAAYLGALWALDLLPDFQAPPAQIATDSATGSGADSGNHAGDSSSTNAADGQDDWQPLIEAAPGEPWNRARAGRGLFSLARACGLRVAESRLARAGDADVLLVRGRAGTSVTDQDVTAAFTLGSFLTIADQLRRASATPRAELRELFGRLCFRAAIAQRDGTGGQLIIDQESHCRLAPLIVAGVPTSGDGAVNRSALTGPDGSPLTRAMLLAVSGRFLLGAAQAQSVIDATVATIDEQWRLAMRRAGVSDGECERIAPAFAGL